MAVVVASGNSIDRRGFQTSDTIDDGRRRTIRSKRGKFSRKVGFLFPVPKRAKIEYPVDALASWSPGL
jgi:hypothetical protein